MTKTAALARSITWTSSKQTFLTAWLLVDRDLVDDCMPRLRLFPLGRRYDRYLFQNLQPDEKSLYERQKKLVDDLYHGRLPQDLCPEEEMLAELVAHDRGRDGGLNSFIHNFMAVIEFDTQRKGRLVTRCRGRSRPCASADRRSSSGRRRRRRSGSRRR